MKKLLTIAAALAITLTMGLLLTGCGNDPQISGIGSTVKVNCGTEFNLDNYLNENLKITDVVDEETVEYQLKDLEYEISCDGEIYNEETGDVDTSDYGKFDFQLKVKDEDHGKASLNFTLKLNPLTIQKGYYIYSDDVADSGLSLMGFCAFTNGSKTPLKIDEIEFQYYDDEGIMVSSYDMPDIASDYVGKGDTGFAYDAYSDAIIESEKDISKVKVNISYSPAKAEDSTIMECGEARIVNGYDYNVSGFAAEFVVTNPMKKKAECILLAGMYDAEDNLIGVMDCMDRPNIAAGGKAKAIAAWLPDSSARPDKTVKVKASACGYIE